MDNIKYELVSPQKLLAAGEAKIITLPASEGDMGVMVGHAPVMTSLRHGMLCIEGNDGKQQKFFVEGGFADISPDNITLLSSRATPEDEMTEEMKAGG